jgi:uncharacterized membrane protein/nitrite reductase/ring-hydroxylating ferredoxin subunit
MLIPFPIAFFTGALVADIVALALTDATWGHMASWLDIGGVVMGLVAAFPGLIDYFATVPPNSTAKSRATKHMVLNVTIVAIFFFANMARIVGDLRPSGTTLLLEALGVILLVISGWLGGTLAYRNQIGVDHRYAGAGKWSTTDVKDASQEIDVAGLGINQMRLIFVGEKRVVVGRTESGFVAFDDRCSHRGGSLADGAMICGTVQCPWHGSQFDCASGAVKAGPAKEGIRTYQLQITGSMARLRL